MHPHPNKGSKLRQPGHYYPKMPLWERVEPQPVHVTPKEKLTKKIKARVRASLGFDWRLFRIHMED